MKSSLPHPSYRKPFCSYPNKKLKPEGNIHSDVCNTHYIKSEYKKKGGCRIIFVVQAAKHQASMKLEVIITACYILKICHARTKIGMQIIKNR